MPKEDIFSKINLKDYNNELEGILEQKAFSEDVKSLLLSMLYKVENGYEDYKTIKTNVSSKKYFVKKIIQIIKEKCNEIEFIKSMTEQSKQLENKKLNFIVDKEKGKIKVYQNERMLLEALVTLNQNDNLIDEQKYNFAIGMQEILTKGNRMNLVEVIRDFNGWSWDITTGQMESKNINLIYQNLSLLVGNRNLQTWVTNDYEIDDDIELPNNEILRSKYNDYFGMTKEETKKNNKIDYFQNFEETLKNEYGSKAEGFINYLKKAAICIGCNRNEKQRKIMLEEQEKIRKKLVKMQDNKSYLEELSIKKRKINTKIRQIDKILSDKILLKNEYQKRNSKLSNEKKIFSISHLVIMLQKEREQYLKDIKICNKQMEPKEFVKMKRELELKLEFYNDVVIKDDGKVDEESIIEKFQLEFLKCFETKINKSKTKEETCNLIYQLRYYEHIPYKQGNVKQIELIKEELEKVEKMVIKKACSQKILVLFSENEMLNTQILKNIFESKIINLANTIYVLKYNKGILKIDIFDTNIKEDEKEIEIKEKVELQVKLNKKIKLFE